MSDPEPRTWQAVRSEVMRRISTREWQPGDLIPGEAELAREFGCARATVNRALRAVAEAGYLDRRRKAGSRVALHPVRKATLEISLVRLDVEGRGQSYRHRLVSSEKARPPRHFQERFGIRAGAPLLHLQTLHFADDKPFLLEDRWINPDGAPGVFEADFTALSANEWLVRNAPLSHGEVVLSAAAANDTEARALEVDPGAALFVLDRATFMGATLITSVRMAYAPGYRIEATI